MTTLIIAVDFKTPKILLKAAIRWMGEIGGSDRFLVEIGQTTVEFPRHRTTYSQQLHMDLAKLFGNAATIRVENHPPQQLSLMNMPAPMSHYQE